MSADLRGSVIVCAQTGTVLSATHCYLLTDDETTDAFFDEDVMTDSECGEFARDHGRKLSDIITLFPVLPGEDQRATHYRRTASGCLVEWDEPGENF